MTNPNYCVLALCVDRSGSMLTVKDDAEGAIAHIIEQQKDVPGRCEVMLGDFSYDWQLVYSLRPVQDVPSYFLTPMGGTALLDGIGHTITELGRQLKALPEDDRPAKVIVAVQTDGQENSSKHYSLASIRTMIEHQRDVYGWQFLFLGADMDAVSVGAAMGFAAGQTMSYTGDRHGTYSMADAVSTYVAATRAGAAPQTLDPNRGKDTP